MQRLLLFIPTIFISLSCLAQDADSIKDSLLHKIESLQLKNHETFSDGLFISERFKSGNRGIKTDNNIFFPALINYTLQSIRHDFALEEQIVIDSINDRIERNYPQYSNRKGNVSYNFWQTHPDLPMPNSKFWSKSERAKLPDDLDCTSIIYLTLPANDSIDHLLKQKIIKHTNLHDRQIKSIFRKYQNYKAYFTWFAQRLKQDFDVCVMANTLLYIFDRDFELNEHDRETICLIKDMVINNEHIRFPHIISPYYKNTAIILYHLSRVMAASKNGEFDNIKSKIVTDIKKSLQFVNNRMEKILLISSLNRLNVKTNLSVNLNNIENDFERFCYFYVNSFHGSNITLKRILGRSNFLHHYYRCRAYYWTLILEYLVLNYETKQMHKRTNYY
jgi:hypothetical protein